MTEITNGETMPKERVYVVQLKPWEAMFLIPGPEEGQPLKAVMDRRAGEFDIKVTGEKIELRGDGEPHIETLEHEAQQMRCPGCAGADLVWRVGHATALLGCAGCDYEIIRASLDALMSTLTADALYEMPAESWEWA